MTIQEKSRKAVVSVVAMADMLALSKSRFYALIQSGIFPQPVRHESCKRPVFDANLQQKCLEIRQTGIGHNGEPVLFNRKRRKPAQPKPRQDQHPIPECAKIECRIRCAYTGNGLADLKVQNVFSGKDAEFLGRRLGVVNAKTEDDKAANVAEDGLPH